MISVPSNKRGVIIGKKGATIKNFRKKSGAKIDFTKDQVEITGNPHSVDLAQKLIQNHLKNVENQNSLPSFEVGANDWLCECNNTNWHWRKKCNKCQKEKPSDSNRNLNMVQSKLMLNICQNYLILISY